MPIVIVRDMNVLVPTTSFLGKRGQIGLSRHKFAATAPFPDLSTPLDSLYFSGYAGALGVKIGVVSGRQFLKKVC